MLFHRPVQLLPVTALLLTTLVVGCECAAPATAGQEGEGEANEGEGEGERTGGEGEGEDQECIAGLTLLELTPADSEVLLDGTSVIEIAFDARGSVGGADIDLDEALLSWSVARDDDTDPGTVDETGRYSPNPATGGVVTVTATDGCVAGSTTVRFRVDGVIGSPIGDPADWQAAPVTDGAVPVVIYPSDQTRFPRNIFRQIFQWDASGYTEFRLTFAGEGSTVTVFTDGVHPSCTQAGATDAGCFEADEQVWTLIAASNAGGTATWTVDALDRATTPPTVRRAASITIGFSRRDVEGAVFYWSTTSAGIRRANIRDASPEDYIAAKPTPTTYDVEGEVGCVACHTVSRSGRYMTAPVKSEVDDSLWVMEVTAAAPPTPLVTSVADTGGHGFATFSPDDVSLVAAWGGRLWEIRRETGEELGDLDLAGLQGTHPDWSPDGTQLVFATRRGDAPGDASLALIPYLGAQSWGAPVTWLDPPAGKSLFFPMFSPEGRYVAFVQGEGGHGDRTAKLFLTDVTSATPSAIELTAANSVVNNAVTDGENANLGPTWAPPGDLYWVAFNSNRAFGVIADDNRSQIWVAAVDPARLEQGVLDPSFPAFRLPFQGLEEDNHRAFWALDVRDVPVGEGEGEGAGEGEGEGEGEAEGEGACVDLGDLCEPGVDDCCAGGALCDTVDDGETYICLFVGG